MMKGTKRQTTSAARVLVIAAIMGFYGSAEFMYISYAPTVWQFLDPERIDAPTAAYMSSIMFSTFTIGPLINTFVSLRLKADIIVAYHLVAIIIALASLYLFRSQEIEIIFAAHGVLGKNNWCWGKPSNVSLFARIWILGNVSGNLFTSQPIP